MFLSKIRRDRLSFCPSPCRPIALIFILRFLLRRLFSFIIFGDELLVLLNKLQKITSHSRNSLIFIVHIHHFLTTLHEHKQCHEKNTWMIKSWLGKIKLHIKITFCIQYYRRLNYEKIAKNLLNFFTKIVAVYVNKSL